MDEVGDIRVAAYRAGGFLSEDSEYAATLHDLGADGLGHVLVALDDEHDGGAGSGEPILGTVMLQLWPHAGHVVTGPDEAEIRALAVRPKAQGQGTGSELLAKIMERAAAIGVPRLVLCTEPGMRAAHRLYERAGFTRLPERDWSPAPGVTLIAYALDLRPDHLSTRPSKLRTS